MGFGFRFACLCFLLLSSYPEKSSSCFLLLAKLTEEVFHSINAIEQTIHLFQHHHHGTPTVRFFATPPPALTTTPRPTTTIRHTTTPRTTTTAAPTPPTTTLASYTATTPGHVLGVVCYSCTGVATDGSCSAVALCKANEVCAVYHDPSGYSHRCLDANVCSAAKAIVPDRCWECCSGSLCNKRCAKETCVDTDNCGIMKMAGFTVCADPKLAHTDCKKSCNHCSDGM